MILGNTQGYTAFSERIPNNDAHISTTEGASHEFDDVGDLNFHSTKDSVPFNQSSLVNTTCLKWTSARL